MRAFAAAGCPAVSIHILGFGEAKRRPIDRFAGVERAAEGLGVERQFASGLGDVGHVAGEHRIQKHEAGAAVILKAVKEGHALDLCHLRRQRLEAFKERLPGGGHVFLGEAKAGKGLGVVAHAVHVKLHGHAQEFAILHAGLAREGIEAVYESGNLLAFRQLRHVAARIDGLVFGGIDAQAVDVHIRRAVHHRLHHILHLLHHDHVHIAIFGGEGVVGVVDGRIVVSLHGEADVGAQGGVGVAAHDGLVIAGDVVAL